MMKSLDVPQHLVETYLSLLRNLSYNSKLELISALSLSMKNEQLNNGLAKTLFGAFETNKSAEQVIEEIKQSRYFNRKVEKL
jgi:hypothetical protein